MGRRTGLAHDPKMHMGLSDILPLKPRFTMPPFQIPVSGKEQLRARRPIISNLRLVHVKGGREMFVYACHITLNQDNDVRSSGGFLKFIFPLTP